ncbi:MAG: MFS transporter [Acidobacteriaceae bacterium]
MRWNIAILLGIGVLINYFDRVNLSVSHTGLEQSFGISDVVYGYLLSAYNIPYAICQIPMGALLDRFGVKPISRIGTLLWSAASFAAAAAVNVPMFYSARLLLGVGEAPFFPANAKAIGRWFPPERRSFATSLFDSAAKFSSALGIPIIGIIVLRLGWRMGFIFTGLVSFAYFLAFYFIYRDPHPGETDHFTPEARHSVPESAYTVTPTTTPASRLSFLALLRQRKVLGLAIGFGAYNYVFYLLLTWLPSYFHQALHINLFDSLLFTAVPWLIATAADLLVGGLLVDILIHRGFHSSRVRMTVLVAGTLFGLGIFGAAFAHTRFEALAWITISITGLSAAAPVGWSLPSLIVPEANVGSVGGIVNFSNQISGILAPIITGYIVQLTHSFAIAFYVAAAYLLIGIAAYLFLLRDISQVSPESLTA